MGCGASVAKSKKGNATKSSSSSTRPKKKVIKKNTEAASLMDSLKNHGPIDNEDSTIVQVIEIRNGQFITKTSEGIECDNTVEFQVLDSGVYDIIQVYKDGKDFHRVKNGYRFNNIKSGTSPHSRRIPFSFDLNKPQLDMYFCIITSSERSKVTNASKYPAELCEKNYLKLVQTEVKFQLTDEKQSQKVYLHMTDSIEIQWTSQRGYRIEERRYCPVSGGFYIVEQPTEKRSQRPTSNGTFTKTFDELGMSFLLRINDANQIHDIVVCVVNEKYRMKHIEITDDGIQPNLVLLEQNDWAVFDWDTKRKQTVVQIEPFAVESRSGKSIELKTSGTNFFWPGSATRRGYLLHQFNELGVYCYKTATNQVGTIIVEPRRTVHQIPVFGEQLIHKINTNGLVQFNWRMDTPDMATMLMTLDPQSSVVPHAFYDVRGVFNCAAHRCTRVDAVLQHHLFTCETILINIPQHGLYNFAYTEDESKPLLSIIVENEIDKHKVFYDERNAFDPPTLIVNRCDQVWFEPVQSAKVAAIYQTDEFGKDLESSKAIFQPQSGSVNCFMHAFPQTGIYYFSMTKDEDEEPGDDAKTPPLAVVVLPDITFHYRAIQQGEFDNDSILTNVSDFVIWLFERTISHNVGYVKSNDTMQDLISCHERATPGRIRQCLGAECIQPGTFFFANPEFERITGSEEDRLIATVIVEPPFGQNCFVVTNRGFVPNLLSIFEDDTISWLLSSSAQNDRIYVLPSNKKDTLDEDDLVNRNISQMVHNVRHLHTFDKPGEYVVRSNRLKNTATVVVYSKEEVKSKKKQVATPRMVEEIDTISHLGNRVHLTCPDRHATIFFTTDGSPPTQRTTNVHEYNAEEGVLLHEHGLHVLRAYATDHEKIASSIVTSSPTFVLDTRELEQLNAEQQMEAQPPVDSYPLATTGTQGSALSDSCNVLLTAALQQPNKLYGNVQVQPSDYMQKIDHFVLYINDVAQKDRILPADPHFSANGFAGGEQYEVYVVAHPKSSILDGRPIVSNKLSFAVAREVESGGPLISLVLSKNQDVLLLVWAHIQGSVEEYNVYVNNEKVKTITKHDFDNYYGIQFEDVKQRRKYTMHVDATMKSGKNILKSNVVSIVTPMKETVSGTVHDAYFPYIVTNNERPTAGEPLQIATQKESEEPRTPAPPRKADDQPIASTLGDDGPTISYKPNPNGITLFWKTKSPEAIDAVDSYQIVVDKKPYGDPLSPTGHTKAQVNLSSGKHECYLQVTPKDKSEETYASNILKVDVPRGSGVKYDSQQGSEPSGPSSEAVIDQKDLPIPKLSVQTVSETSIRSNWYLDRPLHKDAFVAFYEVHVRGPEFAEKMTSDESSRQHGYTEHVWNTTNSPLEISGIFDRNEYTVSVWAFFQARGSSDGKYLTTKSNEVKTTRIDPLIDFLTRPLLQVVDIGVQTVNLSWSLEDSVDPGLVKGYRIILNSKPTEILPANQQEYELRNLKPGTTNEIQISVTSHPDFVDDKISEPIRIVCPKRPPAPTIQVVRAEKPFSIRIKWQPNEQEHDDNVTYRLYLDGNLHEEIDNNGREEFTYDFVKLQPDHKYSIYIKSLLRQKKLEGNSYQCLVESNNSNELKLKCAVPPKGTVPKIDRMHDNGVEISWDAPVEHGDVKTTEYQILNNGRSIGKALPLDKRRASINDLQPGERYDIQVVPITDQPGGILFRKGEAYDTERHGHYLPSEKLRVDFNDLVQVPKEIWFENISGRSALVCWSSIDDSMDPKMQPDAYKLYLWNDQDIPRDNPTVIPLSKDKTTAPLKDLRQNTMYEIKLEASKKRRHPTTNDSFPVFATSDVRSFTTGSPPDPPLNLHLIACTNTTARIGFDPFVEHNAEIKTLRVLCRPVGDKPNAKEIIQDLPPDATEVHLENLTERTTYILTVYGVTDEYLTENRCQKAQHLPRKLKPSEWLPNQSFQFQTSGCEAAHAVEVVQSSADGIQLKWKPAKVYGSTTLARYVVRWQAEPGSEGQDNVDRSTTKFTIRGPLPAGKYKIFLDSVFSVRVTVDDDDDDSSRRESTVTSQASASVRFRAPATCEQPQLYLTGYTTNTVDLAWNKPGMFETVEQTEKNSEQPKEQRQLIDYRVDLNDRKHKMLEQDHQECTLTGCEPGESHKVQLVARTRPQNESTDHTITDGRQDKEPCDETPSKPLQIQTLKKEDYLQSFRAHFEFNHSEFSEERKARQSLGKINVEWTVHHTKDISHFVLQWRSSKDLHTHEKKIASNETCATIETCDEKHYYVIDITVVTNDGRRAVYEKLTVPVPGVPDAPQLWLVKTTDTSFLVEWSEAKSYGIPVIGYELYIAGKLTRDSFAVDQRQAEIPSHINRTYQVAVCAVTDNPQRLRSPMSEMLSVITTPASSLAPTVYYNNNDGSPTSFDQSVARIIPVQIDAINEEKLHVDWRSFLHTPAIRTYYIHYTCLNNGEVRTMKVSKRLRHAVLSGLRPGFTYGIMVMAVDKNGAVLYVSDKSTIQMNAPPNAPIVAITEREHDHVKLEWRLPAGYGQIVVTGYKIVVNNRLAAILSPDQLSYTLTNGIPCDIYTVRVQALSSDKNMSSPMSRAVQFAWPGVKPGAFRRIDDGQSGAIVVAWEFPKFEDETEKLVGYKVYSENVSTHAVHCHGDFDTAARQATINGLSAGQHLIWLEILGEKYQVQSRPITVVTGRFASLSTRQSPLDKAKCTGKKQQRVRSAAPHGSSTTLPPIQ